MAGLRCTLRVRRANYLAFQGLLRGGATVDRQTDKGWTALMYAVKEGHESCVRALLAAGAARGDIAKVVCADAAITEPS